MAFPPDLPAYFARIGYCGSREPTRATLDALCAHHIEAIPFENLDVLLGRPVPLDPAQIERKLVHERRGGYCFEHNTLLLHVLEALGYEVVPLSACVRFGRPREYVAPRTHVFLRVQVAGEPLLADVGVGGFSLSAALRLVLDEAQATPHERRRIVAEGRWSALELRAPGARLFHQVEITSGWHDLYEFTLEQMPAIDREIGNWYTSAHPHSHFRDRLIVARATPSGRIILQDRELTVRSRDGRAHSRLLQSADELLAVLAEHFGLVLPPGTRFACTGLAGLE